MLGLLRITSSMACNSGVSLMASRVLSRACWGGTWALIWDTYTARGPLGRRGFCRVWKREGRMGHGGWVGGGGEGQAGDRVEGDGGNEDRIKAWQVLDNKMVIPLHQTPVGCGCCKLQMVPPPASTFKRCCPPPSPLTLLRHAAFQWFLTAFSVRPTSLRLILDQWLPRMECHWMSCSSSGASHPPFLRSSLWAGKGKEERGEKRGGGHGGDERQEQKEGSKEAGGARRWCPSLLGPLICHAVCMQNPSVQQTPTDKWLP
jgi:hypothetical protein